MQKGHIPWLDSEKSAFKSLDCHDLRGIGEERGSIAANNSINSGKWASKELRTEALIMTRTVSRPRRRGRLAE